MRPWANKALKDLLLEVTTPGSREIFADVNRTDAYTPDGTQVKPYKIAEDAVLAANFMATAASPVHIHLASGTYNEDAFSLSPYVKLQGSGWGMTILKANDVNNHFITLGAASILRDVNVWGPTLAGKAAIYHAANDPRPVVVADVTISRGYYGFYSNPVASIGQSLLENFTFAYAGSNTEELVRVEGFGDCETSTSLAAGPINSIVKAWVATGANAVLTVVDGYHKVSGGVGVYCDNSARTRVLATVFSNGLTALEAGPNGAPMIRGEGVLIHRTWGGGYTNDLKLDSVSASIHYTGRCSRDRIDNAAGGDLNTFGMNDFTGEEGGMVLGELNVGAHATSVLPMVNYGRDAYLSGLVTGGQVTRNAGRVLDVAGGNGYINNGVDPIKVTWTGPVTVTVAAGATEYVYVTAAGAVSHSAVQPDYATNIVLAQATADATDIVALTRDEIWISHSLSRLQEFFEDVIGPLCVTAANVTASGTPLKLVLAAGEFTVGLSERSVVGSSPVTFTPVWRDSFGGWTYGAPTDTIDVNHYDNNSGTPAVYGVDTYKRDSIVVLVSDDGDEVYLVYGQNAFASAPAATAGASNLLPDMLHHYGMHSADVVSHQAAAAIDSVIDMRPFLGQNSPVTAAAAADHDLLLNLTHDTHPQYQTPARELTAHGTYPGAHVTGGDAHDHTAGAGAQIDHLGLSNIGTRTHLQLESDIAAKVAVVIGTAPVVSSGGTSPAISITAATPAAAGSMSAADKTKLDGMTAGAAVASVSGTAPIASSGGTTPAISIAAASGAGAGSMSAADFTKLAGIAAGATVNIFGNGYQSAMSAGRSTFNTNTTFQNKVTLTTPALPAGTYRIGWSAVLDGSATNQNVEAQLYNTTDAAIVGVVQVFRPSNAAERVMVGGMAEVVFAGVAKTFNLQYRTANTGSTVGIADAHIEIWRVQ